VVGLAIRLQEIGDSELEEFVESWLDRKTKKYHEVVRIGAANDKGRDVIGFLSDRRHEGPWELYQCKRKTRNSKLGTPEAMGELGKLFYHYVEGSYATLPVAFAFVSPRGVVGPLQDLIFNPSRLGPYLISRWDQDCVNHITSHPVPLSPAIRAVIEGFNFARVSYLAAPQIVKDADAAPALSKLLGLIPEEAPPSEAPPDIQPEELVYIDQLRQVYGEVAGKVFATADEVLVDADHGEHLRLQRTRFFEAAAFTHFHRDNTAPGAVETFRDDVFHGVIEVYSGPHASRFERVQAVMKHAGVLQVALLGRVSRIPVRQGMCHHLTNEGWLKWMP
jgi:hypothetical protein